MSRVSLLAKKGARFDVKNQNGETVTEKLQRIGFHYKHSLLRLKEIREYQKEQANQESSQQCKIFNLIFSEKNICNFFFKVSMGHTSSA